LTNLFTARRPKPAPAAAASGGVRAAVPQSPPQVHQADRPVAPVFDYERFCRFYLQQSYDIAAARDDELQPFSDIYGELQFNLGRYLRLDSDASYDTYASRFSSHNLGATLADRRGNRLQVEHRYSDSLNESIRGTLSLRLSDRLTVRGEYERNLLDDVDIVKGAGFLYTAQCWSVDFYYAVEGDDNRFAFLIDLLGIGGFGK
jgi:LPS-assembly protein